MYGFPSSSPFPGPGSGIIRVGDGGTGEPGSVYENFVESFSLVGVDALADADPDHDGVLNVVELLLGTDPTESGSSSGRISLSVEGEMLHFDFVGESILRLV